ncbi:MAG: hypothetical protein R3324_01370, partial [Halobacteriales archaeon]|nr:hypothetical protein [Halobacteriales archaeon]
MTVEELLQLLEERGIVWKATERRVLSDLPTAEAVINELDRLGVDVPDDVREAAGTPSGLERAVPGLFREQR